MINFSSEKFIPERKFLTKIWIENEKFFDWTLFYKNLVFSKLKKKATPALTNVFEMKDLVRYLSI